MGYGRRYSEVAEERLIHWFLFSRKFHMDIPQLAEVFLALQKVVRLGSDWGYVGKGADRKYQKISNPKKQQVQALLAELRKITSTKQV